MRDDLDDLRRFSWHTGASLRPLGRDDAQVLFRDVGIEPLLRFLNGRLERLAGPLSPLLYARTAAFVEPYSDFENTGRLMFLRPAEWGFWCSGVPDVRVARATRPKVDGAVIYVPGWVDLKHLSHRAAEMTCDAEAREELGASSYDDAIRHERARLAALALELDRSEQWAAPIRALLQGGTTAQRARVREALDQRGLGEDEVCAAWHHVSVARRRALQEALPTIHEEMAL